MRTTKTVKPLGTVDALSMTVGTMVGAGIFSVLGLTVKTTGPSAVLSWIFVVLLSLPMAYTFSDLTGALAESGGPYTYLRNKASWLGLWAAWLFLLSALGAALGLYMSLIGMLSEVGIRHANVVGLIVLVILTAIVTKGIHLGARVQKWLSILTVMLLLLCITLGFCHMTQPNWIDFHRSSIIAPSKFFTHGWFACAMATFFAFWTYSGWEAVAVPSGSYKSKRHLAMGMMLGSLLVGLLYVGVAFATVLSIPTTRIAEAMNPLVYVGGLAGPVFQWIIAWGTIMIVISALMSWLLACSSLLQAVSRDGLIPSSKSVRAYKGEYHPVWPWVVFVLIAVVSLLPVFTAAIAASSMTALLAYAAVFITVACDKQATWDGVIRRAFKRRILAAFSLLMTIVMIVISGWQQLWPTLCLTGVGGCLVFFLQVVKLRRI